MCDFREKTAVLRFWAPPPGFRFCHNPRVWQTDGQTEFSSLDRVCIPCSKAKSPLSERNEILHRGRGPRHYHPRSSPNLVTIGSGPQGCWWQCSTNFPLSIDFHWLSLSSVPAGVLSIRIVALSYVHITFFTFSTWSLPTFVTVVWIGCSIVFWAKRTLECTTISAACWIYHNENYLLWD